MKKIGIAPVQGITKYGEKKLNLVRELPVTSIYTYLKTLENQRFSDREMDQRQCLISIPPENARKPKFFPTFSGVIEMGHSPEKG